MLTSMSFTPRSSHFLIFHISLRVALLQFYLVDDRLYYSQDANKDQPVTSKTRYIVVDRVPVRPLPHRRKRVDPTTMTTPDVGISMVHPRWEFWLQTCCVHHKRGGSITYASPEHAPCAPDNSIQDNVIEAGRQSNSGRVWNWSK